MRKKAKKVTKSKQEIIKERVVLFFIACFMLSLYTRLFVKTEIVNLNVKVQDNENQITELTHQNESLTIEVSELSTYYGGQVAQIVKQYNLTVHPDNIVTLRNLK